jgi:hypothetical protein
MESVSKIQNAMCKNIVLFACVAMNSLEMHSTAAMKLDVDQTVNVLQQKLASTKNALIHANTLNVDKMHSAKLITITKLVAIAMKATMEILWLVVNDPNALEMKIVHTI